MADNSPLVSVLIPAYHAHGHIAETIRSVLEGGLPADQIEILLESDDGDAYAHLAGLPALRIACSGITASGPGQARNRALARARGRFITYIDADDLWAKGWLAAALKAAEVKGLAFSPVELFESDALILRLWAEAPLVTLQDLGRSGGSLRGVIAREICPPFATAPAQDIHHAVLCLAGQAGEAPLSDLPYILRLHPQSLTKAQDFSARVDQAYQDYIMEFQRSDHALAESCAAVFAQKRVLNQRYMREGQGESYYAFIARLMREGQL